jgi:hypothetical protein
MGTMGPGVFENDYALDIYADEISQFWQQIEEVVDDPDSDIDDIEGPLALVEMLRALSEHCRPIFLPRAQIDRHKQRFLEIYDAGIDHVDPTPDYKENRRAVIEATFDTLARAVREPPTKKP